MSPEMRTTEATRFITDLGVGGVMIVLLVAVVLVIVHTIRRRRDR